MVGSGSFGCAQPVQPHACGEKKPFPQLSKNGKRFNPTHVGKRETPLSKSSFVSVQPHACGEKAFATPGTEDSDGSTPRMWGKERYILSDHYLTRFNPTHVGKSLGRIPFWKNLPVQPHACGEKTCHFRQRKPFSGSTPRMWGKGRRLERS